MNLFSRRSRSTSTKNDRTWSRDRGKTPFITLTKLLDVWTAQIITRFFTLSNAKITIASYREKRLRKSSTNVESNEKSPDAMKTPGRKMKRTHLCDFRVNYSSRLKSKTFGAGSFVIVTESGVFVIEAKFAGQLSTSSALALAPFFPRFS